jgi:hypothetical protein
VTLLINEFIIVRPSEVATVYTSVQHIMYVVAGCPSALRTENHKYVCVDVSLSFRIGDRAERTKPSFQFRVPFYPD